MDTQRRSKNFTRDVPPIAPDALAKRISIDAGEPPPHQQLDMGPREPY
jgi:hypothetical protein